ncbi:C4b-binding protein alpha chain-like [Lontra canadensis]|uniref:C4b-binding protein alpha chain-like n=1 Tax=Lontra canadensis TaxID=76717 RepID=UPI0013F3866A|nr:C4b-binding protein alpha chain-like [Lontra canadensis]XP_032734042.1 C4b-binding protein alpha chain-like [Lontra canadensis]XP_032734043.1 C4b-binding protein alpha chain-like [Lontra canadensis]XP_032734044.1 C4b-binding protein alpha chain-like [Lontra canadensis]
MWENHQGMHPRALNGILHRKEKMAAQPFFRLWRASDPTLFQMILVAALMAPVLGDCDPPPNLYFASLTTVVNETYFKSGTVLRYTCRPGYGRVNYVSPTITCRYNKWDYNEFCVKKRCRHPGELENGKVIAETELVFGSQLKFLCSEGYILIGKTTSYCEIQDKGVGWSDPLPQCIVAKCKPPPDISNGKHNGVDEDFYTYGSSVTYRCDPNFSMIGKASISCTVENKTVGVWSPSPPTCKKIVCVKPTVKNGIVISGFRTTYTYKNSMVFDCERGFILNGSSLIHCGENGDWDPPPPICVLNSCTDLPDIQNASWERYNNHVPTKEQMYNIGTVLRYTCSAGYKPASDGPTTVTCQRNLTWTPHIGCKEVCCPIPELENGEIISQRTSSVNSCAYFYRDVVYYKCYKKHLEASCQEDGTWYPKTPTCDDHCDFPPEVAHGYYEKMRGLQALIKTEVIYRCDKGYTLVGEAKLSCSSSHWTPAAPQCKALCPKPEIAHAKLSVNKYQYLQSSNVIIQCDSGYELVGPQSVTCSESRTWYPELPKCEWVIPEDCEHVRKGKKIMQCLPNPADVKMAMELYKLSLEIELLELQRDKEKKYTTESPV